MAVVLTTHTCTCTIHCTVDCFAAGSSRGFVVVNVSPFKELVQGGVFSSREGHTRDYLFVVCNIDIDSIAVAKMDFRLALLGGGYKPVADTNKGTLSLRGVHLSLYFECCYR